MLATLADEPPRHPEEWFFEMKYDGFRGIAGICNGRTALWTRNSLDLKARFPTVAAAIERIKADQAVIDGEIVALDSSGTPRFQLLQQGNTPHAYFAFDLLWLNGVDLRARPLEESRELLGRLLSGSPKGILLSAEIAGDPAKALAAAAERGYEGLIAKRRGSVYENRRSKAWLKLKAVNVQEFAIAGYMPATHSSSQIGSLILGVMDEGEMRFAGKVGTGFSAKLRGELMKDLSRDRSSAQTVTGAPRFRDATWVRPRLVAQVQFTEWTADGRLRHPSFLGLREDKRPEDCVREKKAEEKSAREPSISRKASATVSAPKASTKATTRGSRKAVTAAPTVVLTSPDRLLYPRDGITKKDVAAYYDAVAGPMIHALAGRPLALEHWNDGIDKPSWFHQNIGKEGQPWMTLATARTRTSDRDVRHLVADKPETLRWLAQNSVLTLHMWSSRSGNLESPDWLVFDLDPAKGEGIGQAVETALVLRRLFEQLELPSIPKTSGKRGIHLLVPLKRGYTHEHATDFACGLAEAVAGKLRWATTERALAARKGRLYLDCLQNGYGKTIVAPYSLRAIDGAPVSAPLSWSEVTKKLDPLKFNLRTMPDRVAKLGDLFAAALEDGVKLPRLK